MSRVLVSAYPPNIPGREEKTLCRKLEHSTVIMISDAPEFLRAVVVLDGVVLEDAVESGLIGREEADKRRTGLGALLAELVPASEEERQKRLRKVWGLRPEEEVDVVEVVDQSSSSTTVGLYGGHAARWEGPPPWRNL